MLSKISVGKTLTACFLLVLSGCQGSPDSQQSKPSIVGGSAVDTESFIARSTVALTKYGRAFCTGTLIASDLVVSAAHCVEGETPDDVSVTFGTDVSSSAKVDREVTSIGMYKPEGAKFFPNFDIAYLKLAEPAPASHQPMEVLYDKSLLDGVDEVVLAGYGKTATECEDCTGKLLSVKTSFKQVFDNHRFFSLLVFGPTPGRGSCNGDSGGPAYAQIGERWYLIGATNGATATINPGTFEALLSCEAGESIYTFVGDYVAWIEEQSQTSLDYDASLNPRVKARPLASLDQVPDSWAGWVLYDNHFNPAWYTVDQLLALAVRQVDLRDRLQTFLEPEQSYSKLSELKQLSLIGVSLDFASFSLVDQQIADLRPITVFKNLEQLNLLSQKITDFSPLASLPALRRLIIKDNYDFLLGHKTVDFSLAFLNDLNLEELVIESASGEPKDLALVDWSRQTQLKSLTLSGWSGFVGSQMSSLGQLESLELLVLAKNNLVNLQNFSLPESVKELDLSDNQFVDISSLSGLNRIEHLNLSGNPVDVHTLPWGALKSLKHLDLSQTKLQDVEFLKELTELEFLNLAGNQIEDISVLKNLKHLSSVNISDNQVVSFAPLAGLGQLKKVDARNNPWSELQPCNDTAVCLYPFLEPQTLHEACELAVNLNKSGRTREWDGFASIANLMAHVSADITSSDATVCPRVASRLQALKRLQISGSYGSKNRPEIREIGVLRLMTQLEQLDLSRNRLSRLDGLEQLKNLEELDISYNNVNDFSAVESLPKLRKLNLTGNRFYNVSTLNSDRLQELNLSGRQGAFDWVDLDTLGQLPEVETLIMHDRFPIGSGELRKLGNLRRLYLKNNGLTSLSSFWQIPSLSFVSSSGNLLEEYFCGLKIYGGYCSFNSRIIYAGMSLNADSDLVDHMPPNPLPAPELPLIEGTKVEIAGFGYWFDQG